MALPSSFVLGHAIRQLYHSGHATMAADLVYKSVDAELLLPDHILKSEYKTIPKKMPLNLHLFYQIIDGILSVQDQVTLGRKIIEKASLYGFDQTTVQGYFSRGDLYLNSWKAGIEASKVVSTTLKSSSQDHTFKVIRKLAMDNNFVLAMKVADEVIERQKGNASCVFFAMLVTNRVFPRRFQTFESMITNLVKNGQAIYPDIFNAWIKFHLISGNAIKAREIFSEMQKYVSPDLYTYMSFVSYEFRRKRPDLAQIWFEESIQNGIPATTAGLSIMATGYLKAGNLDKALEFYGTMIGYDFKNRHSIPVRDSQYIDDESIGFFTRILWEDRLYNDLCLVISKTALTSKFQESYQTWLMVAMNLLKRNNFCAIALTGTCNHIPSMNLALTSVGKTVIFDPKIITEMSAFLQRVALNANSDDEGMSLKMFKLCFMFLREPALIEKVFGLRHSFLVEQYLKLIVLEMMRMAKDFDCFGFADHPAFILLKSAIPGDFKVVAYVEKMLSNLPDKAEITELSCSLDSIPLHSSKENPLLHMTLMNEVAGKTKSMVIRPTNFSSQIYYIAKNTGKKAAAEFFEKESVNRTVDLTVISNLIRHGLKPKLLETVPNILEYLLEKQLSPTPSFYALLYQRYYKSEKNRNMIFSKLVTAVGENEAYALIIAAFCKVGRMDYADMHLQVFLKKGYLPPDDRFYFNLMTGYVNIGQFENSLYFLGKIIGYDLDDFSRHPDNPLPPDGMTDSDKYHHGFKLSFIKSVISKSIYPDPTPRIEKVVYFLTLFSKNNRQLSVDIIPKIISFSLFNNSCWGLNLLYLNSSTSQELLKDASILLYTKSKQFIYHPKLVESIMKVIKLKVGDYHPTGKSIAQACFEMMFSCDDNPSKLYLELILYTAVSLDFEFEPNLERILEEEAGKEFLNSLKNSNLFEKVISTGF